MRPETPPPVLDGARLLAYAILDETVVHSGKSTLYVDGKQIGAVPCLAIVQDDTVLLLFCDEQWNSIGVVDCSSLPEAKSRGESEYEGLAGKWVDVNVSEEDAARYLQGEGNAQKCSFCGKSPDAVQHLFGASNAYICDSCVSDFYRRLQTSS